MARHRSSGSRKDFAANRRRPETAPESASEVTDIIPSTRADARFRGSALTREAHILEAPELDGLDDVDEVPRPFEVPSEFRSPVERRSAHAYRDSHIDTSDGTDATDVIAIGRSGRHRKQEIPVKGRLMVAAMAVGATAAGAYSMATAAEKGPRTTLAADQTALGKANQASGGMEVIAVRSQAQSAVHAEEVVKAAAFAQERAEREARLQRPMFVMPTRGVWTSGFGYRWGELHGGIDIANAIGTPILAASDGVVISAGPYAGYGNMVKIRHADGTVTLYGHLSSILVNVGQRVWAGDQIAKMGNTGYSTGPHLHFEVLLNGTDRVDPVGWLAKRGLTLGG